MSISVAERRLLGRVIAEARDASTIVLFGSAVRPTLRSSSSDLDVLALDTHLRSSQTFTVQLVAMTSSRLRDRILDGDDLPHWLIRFGKPLTNRDVWESLKQELAALSDWPKAHLKLEKAAERLGVGRALIGMGDFEAAREELLFAVTHLARAALLGSGVFPLSRPELGQQLDTIGQAEIASLVRRLQPEGELPADVLRGHDESLSRLLAEIESHLLPA